MAISPDGKLVASGGTSNVVKIRDLQSGKVVASVEARIGDVKSLSFSPDGRRLAIAGGDMYAFAQVGVVVICDVLSKANSAELHIHKPYVSSVFFLQMVEILFPVGAMTGIL